MYRTVVHDRVHRVEAQAIEVELLEPIQRVADREVAHRAAVGAVVVDARTPGSLVPLGEERRRIDGEVITVGPKMIVDHVKDHHQPTPVGFRDQALEIVRSTVGGGGRVGQHAVIAPVAGARKIADRHDLDRGDAKLHEMVELLDRGGEGARRREGADVELVEHRLSPGATGKVVVPRERGRVDHLARPVHVLRLEAAGGVGHQQPVIDPEAV